MGIIVLIIFYSLIFGFILGSSWILSQVFPIAVLTLSQAAVLSLIATPILWVIGKYMDSFDKIHDVLDIFKNNKKMNVDDREGEIEDAIKDEEAKKKILEIRTQGFMAYARYLLMQKPKEVKKTEGDIACASYSFHRYLDGEEQAALNTLRKIDNIPFTDFELFAPPLTKYELKDKVSIVSAYVEGYLKGEFPLFIINKDKLEKFFRKKIGKGIGYLWSEEYAELAIWQPVGYARSFNDSFCEINVYDDEEFDFTTNVLLGHVLEEIKIGDFEKRLKKRGKLKDLIEWDKKNNSQAKE